MATETEEILEYAAKQFGSQPVEAAMAETNVEESLQTNELQDAAMATAENTETEIKQDAPVETQPVVEAPTYQEPDHNKWLSEQTGGLITSVDDFKQALPKISQYESIAQQKEELERSKISYANGFVKELNELALAGANQDQLKAFVKLNERGDLNELNPLDAKVAKLVLVDGYSEEVARKLVDRDFSPERFEEGSDEYEIAKDELRVSSKSDIEALKKYKADLTTVSNPEKEQQEQARLQQIAQTEQHERLVKQEAPKIASYIQGIGKVNLTGKEGDDAVFLDFPFPDDFKSKVSTMAENYFLDNNEPITQESVLEFAKYAKATYLEENFEKVTKSIWSHAESVLAERIANKYENRSGLAKQVEPDVQISINAERQAFLERVASGR
jgi:hypothetical protein